MTRREIKSDFRTVLLLHGQLLLVYYSSLGKSVWSVLMHVWLLLHFVLLSTVQVFMIQVVRYAMR